jgi:hypothetical protein
MPHFYCGIFPDALAGSLSDQHSKARTGRSGEQFIAVNSRWRLQRIEYQPCELSACFLGRNSALICAEWSTGHFAGKPAKGGLECRFFDISVVFSPPH